jgi:uncharacterized membrane protein YphA (DoxX/SURF4 family)
MVAGISLMLEGSLELRGVPHSALFATQVVPVIVAIFLFAGLWTPFAGTLQVAIELWIIFSHGSADGIHILRAILGASLVMIGPGAWSIDARLFGRKRIDIRVR